MRDQLARLLRRMSSEPQKVQVPSQSLVALRIISRMMRDRALTIDDAFWVEHLKDELGPPRPEYFEVTRSLEVFARSGMEILVGKRDGSTIQLLVEAAEDALGLPASLRRKALSKKKKLDQKRKQR